MAVSGEDLAPQTDGWISDESSFYGDEEMKDAMEQILANKSNDAHFWSIQASLPATIAYSNQADPAQNNKGKARLHWPLEGRTSARQSSESVTDFVKRLPPSRTNIWDHGDWLWVTNPLVVRDEEGDEEALMVSGRSLLEDFKDFKSTLESEGKSSAVVGRRLTPRRTALAEDLKKVAINAKYLSGKWMLFVPKARIDDVWRKVAQAVADNHLGPTTKVATASTGTDDVTLICVYTKDFTDLKDVKRVLDMLVNLSLVDPDSRGIYYKCDAYTNLGIDSKNEYGLRASMYSSADMLRKTPGKKK